MNYFSVSWITSLRKHLRELHSLLGSSRLVWLLKVQLTQVVAKCLRPLYVSFVCGRANVADIVGHHLLQPLGASYFTQAIIICIFQKFFILQFF